MEQEEEGVMMMMINSSDHNLSNESDISHEVPNISSSSTTTSTCPISWKLYENPFYNSHHHQQCKSNIKQIHNLHLPISARKIAASFWDLTFFRPIMETELDIVRGQIIELKAELDHERKARKKVESMNRRLTKEVAEERRGREAMERVCEELAREISSEKMEIDRVKREIQEERKMIRVAEVLREERVQMKLTEAKILLEETLLELEETKRIQIDNKSDNKNQENKVPGVIATTTASSTSSSSTLSAGSVSGKFSGLVLSENNNVGRVSSMAIQGRTQSEPENPHIKRGIKGFVEFPRVVRAIGSKSRHWGTKLECQKSQLRILLKQKSPIRSNNLIMS